MSRSERAFTLLEVLAAVAILGIVYTTLARAAMEGLRAEGDSRRRLEASLLADETLGDIELQIEAGAVPAPGATEDDVDEFVVRVEVTPFEIPGLEEPEPAAGAAAQPIVLVGKGPGVPETPVRQIDVTVVWNDGERERSVGRRTFAFDFEAVSALIQPLAGDENGDVDVNSLLEQVEGLQ